MLDFLKLKKLIEQQMDKMLQASSNIFKVETVKDELWEAYLAAFAPKDNPIFRKRTVHDCQCCRHFINTCGAMVIIDSKGSLTSIWDISIGGGYQPVMDALADLVKHKYIKNILLLPAQQVGTDSNHTMSEEGAICTWDHFHYTFPTTHVNSAPGSSLGALQGDHDVLYKGLTELTEIALNTVLELIDNKSLYRGDEHKHSLINFKRALLKYNAGNKSPNLVWKMAVTSTQTARFKNSVIGTLVSDLSTGVAVEDAVRMFEAKVAPDNYKRSSAIITASMIAKAKEKISSLGLLDALHRRYATNDDISVNNVIYIDKTIPTKEADIFSKLRSKADTQKIGNLTNVEEVSISTFLTSIMHNARGIELLVENRLKHNMLSLIAPKQEQCGSLFAWPNNFSWAYNGDVADSMKDRVKSAGGKVDGVLRFSIQWNEGGDNNIDFDAHCYLTKVGKVNTNEHIYFSNKEQRHPSSGMLDVDIVCPNGKIAVENITWSDLHLMPDGEYLFKVHNYDNSASKTGFSAEIEFNGTIHTFHYPKMLRGGEYVPVATVIKVGNTFTLSKTLSYKEQQKAVWNLTSQTYCKVSHILNSPNYWDNKKVGNNHLFFILTGCNSGEEARGFYNEFLHPSLIEHRKTFEVLGSELKVKKSEQQLSGLGFSTTQRNHVFCKVTTDNNVRIFKLKF